MKNEKTYKYGIPNLITGDLVNQIKKPKNPIKPINNSMLKFVFLRMIFKIKIFILIKIKTTTGIINAAKCSKNSILFLLNQVLSQLKFLIYSSLVKSPEY